MFSSDNVAVYSLSEWSLKSGYILAFCSRLKNMFYITSRHRFQRFGSTKIPYPPTDNYAGHLTVVSLQWPPATARSISTTHTGSSSTPSSLRSCRQEMQATVFSIPTQESFSPISGSNPEIGFSSWSLSITLEKLIAFSCHRPDIRCVMHAIECELLHNLLTILGKKTTIFCEIVCKTH